MAHQQTENVSEVNNINSEDSNKNNVNNSNTIQNGTDITKQPGQGSGQQQCNQSQLQQQTHSQMQNTRQMHPQQQTAQQQASQQNSSNMSEKFSASKSPNQQNNPGGIPVSGGPPGSTSNIISNNGSESQHNIYGGGEIPGGIPPPSHYGIPQPPGGSHHNPEQKDIDPYGHASYSRYHQGGDPNNPEQYRYAHTPILPGKPSSIMSPNRPPQRYVPGQQIQGPTPTLNSLLQSHPPPGQRYPNNYEGQPQPAGPSGQPQQYGPQGWSHQPRPYSPQMGQSYRTPSPGNAGRGQAGYPVPPSQASGSYPPSPQQSLSHPPSQGPVSSQYAAPYPPRYATPPGAAGPNHRSQYSAQYSDSSRSWTGPSNSSPAVSPGPTGHPNAPPSPHQVQHSSIPPPSSPGHVPCASPQPPQASSSPHQEMAGQNSNDSSSGGGNSNNAQSAMRPTPSPTGSSGSRSMSPAVGQQNIPVSSRGPIANQLNPTPISLMSSHLSGSVLGVGGGVGIGNPTTLQQHQQQLQQQQISNVHSQNQQQSQQQSVPQISESMSGPIISRAPLISTQAASTQSQQQQIVSSHSQAPTSILTPSGTMSTQQQQSVYQSPPPPPPNVSHMHGGFKMSSGGSNSTGQSNVGSGVNIVGGPPNPQNISPYSSSQPYSQGNYAPRPPYPTGGYSSGPSTGNQHAPGSNLPQGNNQYGRPMPNHVSGPHPPFPYNQGGWGAPSSPQTSTGMMPNHNQNKGSPIPSQSSMGSPRPPLNYLKQHLQHKGGYTGAPSPTPPPQSFGNGSGGMHPPMGPPHHMGPPHGPPASAMGPPPSAPQSTPPPPGPPQGPPPPPPTTNQQSNIVDNSLAAEHNNVSQDNSGSSSSTLSSQHPVTSVVTTGPDGAPLDEASQQSTISNTSAASTEDPQCATPKSSRKNDPYSHGHLPPPNASPHTGAGAGEDFEMHSPGNWSRTAASPVFNHVPPQDNFRSTTSTKKSDSLCKLYEMDENPERRPWLDKLLSFMEERRTPITACPTISKQPLDLYRLYIYVKERGGFVEVTKSKTWKDIAGLLGIGASSSAAYTLRKHYTKNLLAFECHYDRGGIDPLPIIQQVEAGSKKKATKPTSVPSPAGSSNSQDSFPPNVSGNVSMDGYSNYTSNYPPSAQPDFNSTAQRPPSQNNAQTSHPGAPYQPQPNFNQYGTEQYTAGPPNQYPQTQNQFPPPNRNMFAPYGPESDASGTTPNAFTPYGPRPYNQPPVSNTQTSTTSAANSANPPTASTYSAQPPSQDYYRQQAEQNQPRRHPDFVKDAQPYPGYVQRPQMYGGWQGSPQQYRNQYPSQQAPPQQQWSSPRPPSGPPLQSATQQQQQQQQQQAQAQQQSPQQQQPPQSAGGTPSQWDHQPQPQTQQPPIRYHPPQGPSQQSSPYQTNQQPPQQQQQQQPQPPQQPQQQQPPQQPQQAPTGPPGGPPIPQWSQQSSNSQQQPLQMPLQPQQQQPQPSPLPMSNTTSSPLRPSHRVVAGVATSGKPSFSMPPPQPQMVVPGKPMPSTVHSTQQQVMSGPPPPPHTQPQNFPSAAANQIQKREIVFPPDSVESTTPVLYKRKRLAKSDVCPVDPWRIFMSLRSGLLAESTWALDILNVLLFDDHAVQYFGLSHLPGLLNLLLEHLQKALIEMFRSENDAYECNKLIEGGYPSNNNVENDVDIGQISSIPNPEDRVVILNTTQNYTLMSRKGIPVRIQNADDDIFVSDSPKGWDFDSNRSFQTETPDCSDAWTYGYTERFPHRGIIDIFKSDIVDIPFARYLRSDNNIKENLKRPSIDKCSDFGDYNKRIRNSSNNNNNISNDISKSVSIKEETIDAVEQKHERKETTKPEDNKNASKAYEQKICNSSSDKRSFDPKTTVKDPATILKRRRLSDYEDECYTRDESSLYLVKDSQDASARRCICLSNIFRNLTFVPGNEVILARSPSFLALLGNLLLLNHEHVLRTHKNRNYDREEDTDFGDSCSSLQGEKEWWWEYLIQIRENMLVAIANIAGHLELSKYEEIITRPILDGLLHWAVCPSAHGQDPFPSCGPNSNLSPQRLALEALCKLCVTDANVDLVIATPPFSRLEKLCSVLTRHLCRNEDQVLREFSVNLLHYLAAADSAMSRTVALQSPCISYLVAFIEQAEQTALGVANQNGINYLRENPDSMGTSLDMLRRAAGTLLHLAKHPDNRPLFMQQEQRLLGLVMSHILDQQVALIISKVLFQVSRGCGGSGSGSGATSSSEKLLQKQKHINSAAERCALNLQTINNYRNEKLMNINNYNNANMNSNFNNSNNVSNGNINSNNGNNSNNINNNDNNNNNSNDSSLLSLNITSKKIVNEQKCTDLAPNENEMENENENGNSSDANMNSTVTSENEMSSSMNIKGSISSFKDPMSSFKDPTTDCSEIKTEIKSDIKTEITETTTESSLETGTSTAGDESSSDSSSATVGCIPPSDINAVSSISSSEISALKDTTQSSKELSLVDTSSTMSTSTSPSVTATINNTNNIEKFNNSNSNNNSSSNSNSSSSSNNNSSGNSNSNENANRNLATSITNTTAAVA